MIGEIIHLTENKLFRMMDEDEIALIISNWDGSKTHIPCIMTRIDLTEKEIHYKVIGPPLVKLEEE